VIGLSWRPNSPMASRLLSFRMVVLLDGEQAQLAHGREKRPAQRCREEFRGIGSAYPFIETREPATPHRTASAGADVRDARGLSY
jgi:hypothetical protein